MNESSSCPVETTLGLIGGKYKALILWHLAEVEMRYSQLQKAIPKATPKILTQQLRELESEGLVHREVFPIIPPKVEYSLTSLGRSLMPVLIAMRDWGTNYLRSNKAIEPGCFMVHSNPNR